MCVCVCLFPILAYLIVIILCLDWNVSLWHAQAGLTGFKRFSCVKMVVLSFNSHYASVGGASEAYSSRRRVCL